jgi:ABC-type sugar transport system ATPase subunit
VRFGTPRDALAAGVGMVHQELAFCENLTVAENLCLGAMPARRGLVSRYEMARRAEAMLAEIHMALDVSRPLGELPIAQRQMIQIAGAVGHGARIIVFDEPTSSLSDAEAGRLYDLIGRLTQRGVTCIYVSHRMPEVFRLAHAVSVLRDGKYVGTRPTSGFSPAELVQMMIGRGLTEYFPPHATGAQGEELLRIEELTATGKFERVSFSLHAGEIVGVAGLMGAGRSELAHSLFGLTPVTAGRVFVREQAVHIRTPEAAMRLGLGLVPEDRKRQGIIPLLSGLANLSLPSLPRLSRGSWIRRPAERALGREFAERLRIRSSGMEATVAGLSGGNQQKIVLARWLAARSRILILDEPTRGVDVGAKAEIHALIGRLAAEGHGVLLISSELPEILSLSSRILVLRGGRLAAEIPHQHATQEILLRHMAGV